MEILRLRSFAIKLLITISVILICVIIKMRLLDSNEVFLTTPEPFVITAEPRKNRSLEVSIVIILTNGSDVGDYRSAMNSVEKYCTLHGYRLLVENDTKYKECTRHVDKFFRRHCHTHQLMLRELKESSYVLFIDADVGFTNPNKLLEDFIEPEFDIYLYNRFYNWEYAAQYLIKNNDRGRKWIAMLAEMEFTLPKSFHGTDNGALHILMMHYLTPETERRNTSFSRLCLTIWENSKAILDLFTMQACTRMVIGEKSEFHEQHVKIFPKGQGWARDIWILRSRWSSDDFMLHSIKEQRLKPDQIAQRKLNYDLIFTEKDTLYNPLAFPVLNITNSENGEQRWIMDGRLKITNALRAKLFNRMSITKLQAQYEHFGKHISTFLQFE